LGVQRIKPKVEFDLAEACAQTRVGVRRVERLTAQEQACLRLVARRLSSKEIAAELGIAKTSVDTYCNRAREKLGVSDRYAAARLMAAERTGPTEVAVAVVLPATAHAPRRVAVGAAAAGALAAALGVASLLAGMAALEELKPPHRARAAEAPPPSAPVTVARDG